jgi:aryl-alcohol dehydrogenase-like predicted oxidoreductase
MKLVRLGKSPLQVSNLCFGGNVFGWTADQATSFAVLDAFVAAGGNFIDTADVYSRWAPGHQGGESESVIGLWLAARPGIRQKLVIASKVGMELAPDRKGLSARWIATAVEDSLRRLKTDVIDLYQSHTDDASVPFEETLGAYDKLIRAGKVRYLGASNYSAARLAEALAVARAHRLPEYICLQPLFNLYDREPFEKDLLALCAKENLAVINFYALASGFLTGKYRSEADAGKSPRGQGVVKKYLNERGTKILAALDEVAFQCGANPGQIAIAWLLHQQVITSPIASATSLAQLDELIAATRIDLTETQLHRLGTASALSLEGAA